MRFLPMELSIERLIYKVFSLYFSRFKAKHIGFTFLFCLFIQHNKWCINPQNLRFYHAIHKSLGANTLCFRVQTLIYCKVKHKRLQQKALFFAFQPLFSYFITK